MLWALPMPDAAGESKRSMTVWLVAGGCSLAFLCLLAAVVALFAVPKWLESSASRSERIASPDGSRVLVTSIVSDKADPTAYLTVAFEIRDAQTGEVLFSDTTGASDRMRWSMTWLSNSEIQLTSSDIGDYCWVETPDGTWDRSPC